MSEESAAVRLEALLRYPERPESEFEWEDLLLRLELMPRALKVEIEKAGGAGIAEILEAANERELSVQQLLEEVAIAASPGASPSRTSPTPIESPPGGTEPEQPPSFRPTPPPPGGSSEAARVDRFVRLRGRNFAMLQRRGIDVWNWRIKVPPAGDATVFQLLSLLARNDVEILSRLRTARTSVPGAC